MGTAIEKARRYRELVERAQRERQRVELWQRVSRLATMLLARSLRGAARGGGTAAPEGEDELFTEACRLIQEMFGFPNVSLFKLDESAEELILVAGLPFYSLCAHHLLPFFGEAHIAYVPERALLGIGSVGRLLEHYARRPQLQERLTEQVAEALARAARPRGVIVLLKARQLCMEMRGAKKPGWVMTSAARGCFRDSAWREEFFRRLTER